MTVDSFQGRDLIPMGETRKRSMESKYVPVTSSLRKLDDSRHSLGGGRRRGAGDMGANPIVAITTYHDVGRCAKNAILYFLYKSIYLMPM